MVKRRKPVPGWLEYEVEEKMNEAKFWFQVWHSSNKPQHGDLYQNMRISRRNFKAAKRRCLNAEESIKREKFVEACINGDKDMFEELKKLKGRANSCTTKIDGKNKPDEIADRFKEIYSELYNRTGSTEPMDDLLKEVNDKISDEDLDMVDKVTGELVEHILKQKIKNGKSDPEFDITTDSLKNAPKELHEILAKFLRASLIHGYISHSLLLCAIVPLVKKKNGKLDDSDNYRGIGLSCIILKIFDWILLILFDKELSTDLNQFGFQEESSCAMLSWTVLEVLNSFSRSGSQIYGCLLDYRKAFDFINHRKMFENLRGRKMNLLFLRLLMFIYIYQKCYVRWNNTRSYSFDVTNGTRQGSIFSPKGGFATTLDPMLEELRGSGHGCSLGIHYYGALAWADDVILLNTSVQGLQSMVDICQKHATENDLMFSTDPDPKLSKIVCIAFNCKNKDSLGDIILNGNPLPWKDSVKHIGTTLHSNGTMEQDCREQRAIFIQN